MRVQLDPRHAHQLGRQPAACCDDVGDHQIGRQIAKPWHVEHRHPRRALVNLRPCVGVVVEIRRVQTVQLDGVDPGRAGRIQPFRACEQRGSVPGRAKPKAQRNGRKRVPGVGPGDNGDLHRPTLPQRSLTRLARMTGMTSAVDSTANARTVETFLYAMQDEDFDTVEAAMADNIEWQNVGFPTIRGRERMMKLFRRGEGRFGFEVKIHRIAAEGNAVLTERTDALVIGPLRLQFWVCGVFEVHAGRVTLWRDYFDMLDFTKATVRGIVATVFPSLRPTL